MWADQAEPDHIGHVEFVTHDGEYGGSGEQGTGPGRYLS